MNTRQIVSGSDVMNVNSPLGSLPQCTISTLTDRYLDRHSDKETITQRPVHRGLIKQTLQSKCDRRELTALHVRFLTGNQMGGRETQFEGKPMT